MALSKFPLGEAGFETDGKHSRWQRWIKDPHDVFSDIMKVTISRCPVLCIVGMRVRLVRPAQPGDLGLLSRGQQGTELRYSQGGLLGISVLLMQETFEDLRMRVLGTVVTGAKPSSLSLKAKKEPSFQDSPSILVCNEHWC